MTQPHTPPLDKRGHGHAQDLGWGPITGHTARLAVRA